MKMLCIRGLYLDYDYGLCCIDHNHRLRVTLLYLAMTIHNVAFYIHVYDGPFIAQMVHQVKQHKMGSYPERRQQVSGSF